MTAPRSLLLFVALAGCTHTEFYAPNGADDAGPCDPMLYPCGPVGGMPGQVIPNVAIDCARRDDDMDGSPLNDQARTLQLSDYYRDKNIKVLAILIASYWCGPCRVEQPEVVAAYRKYQMNGSGVAIIEAIVQKQDTTAADQETVDSWASYFKLPFDIACDSGSALAPYYDARNFPAQIVIRTSDMTIQAVHTGYVEGWLEMQIDDVLAGQ